MNVLLLLALLVAAISCTRGPEEIYDHREQEAKEVIDIDHQDLRELLSREDPPLLVDVREPSEFAQGYIPGAVLIPLGELEEIRNRLEVGEPVVLYCRSGIRSLTAANMMVSWGYLEVMNLKGGILAWPYEIVTED